MTKKKAVKSKPGPKPKPIDLEVAYEKAREGADMASIAEAIGRAPNPHRFSNLQKANPELKQAVKKGREENIQAHVEQLIPKAQWAMRQILDDPTHPGFTAATIYLHKALMKLTETHKHEVSGEVQHVHSLSAEDRVKRIQELRNELDSAIDVEIVPENKDDN